MAKVVNYVRRTTRSMAESQAALDPVSEVVSTVDSIDVEYLRSEIEMELQASHAQKQASLLEKQFKEGYSKGYQEAKNALHDQALKRLHEQTKILEQTSKLLTLAVKEIKDEKQMQIEQVKADLIEIVFDVVGKLTCEDFIQDTRRVELLLSNLLEQYQSDHNVKIQLSEYDMSLLMNDETLLEKHPEVHFSACKSVETGGVILKSSKGQLDLRLSTKLEQFMQLLLKHGESN
ncbi:FliH/SctL family protein [Photobacterium kasasachensis]|uniref:FliH/SctL family protein n=1 Tax=Photobacterium kasasachensis TaxID=2910240 RepID=UPI003D098F6E